MLAKLTLAAAAAALAAGCAGNPPARTAAASADKGTLYCWKERLVAEGDSLACNWEASAGDACRSSGLTSIKRSAVASGPRDATLCNNGQWLVAVTTR